MALFLTFLFEAHARAFREAFKVVHSVNRTPDALFVRDCPTRWNSAFLMVQRVISHFPVLERLFTDLASKDPGFRDKALFKDWHPMAATRMSAPDFVQVLKPFKSLTDAAGAAKIPTISSVLGQVAT